MTALLLALALSAFAASKAAPEIVLVVIDEATEKAVGWPLPPEALVDGLKKIEAGRPAAVALKFFADVDDAAVAGLLSRHKNVYLQCAGVDEGAPPDPALLGPAAIAGGEGADFDDRPSVVFPPQGLAAASAGVGFVHVKLNPKSGAAERWQVVSMAGGKRYASLALLVAARAKGVSTSALALKPGAQGAWRLLGPGVSYSLDHEGALPIRFTQPGKGRKRHSFAAVRAGAVPASAFAGRIVVVGPDLPRREDNGLKTPIEKAHPKVELFADAVATLLR
ncbi:MAG: CHASE2 domain-containing protein [Elusimicrobia bacterium]|nr:CHASE2 domain-containing protein [Elusimicrobiota bacterium]